MAPILPKMIHGAIVVILLASSKGKENSLVLGDCNVLAPKHAAVTLVMALEEYTPSCMSFCTTGRKYY